MSHTFSRSVFRGGAGQVTDQSGSGAAHSQISHIPRVEHLTFNAIHYASTTLQQWRRRTMLLDGGLSVPSSAFLHYSLSFHGSVSANSTVAPPFSVFFHTLTFFTALPEPITDLWVFLTLVA